MCNQWKWSYYLLVKLVEMVLLDKMVQPLAQPSKLASGSTENDLTWKVSQAVKIIPLVIIIQLVKMVQPVIWIQSVKGIPVGNPSIATLVTRVVFFSYLYSSRYTLRIASILAYIFFQNHNPKDHPWFCVARLHGWRHFSDIPHSKWSNCLKWSNQLKWIICLKWSNQLKWSDKLKWSNWLKWSSWLKWSN